MRGDLADNTVYFTQKRKGMQISRIQQILDEHGSHTEITESTEIYLTTDRTNDTDIFHAENAENAEKRTNTDISHAEYAENAEKKSHADCADLADFQTNTNFTNNTNLYIHSQIIYCER